MTHEHYLKQELYELIRSDPAIFDFLQSGSLDGIWYWDLQDPNNEWMSPRFWETFGHDPATREHLASEWQDMIHPDDLETTLDNFNRHCADPDHPYDQVVRYTHRKGHTVWVRCRGLAIRDKDGTPRRMLGAHTDITSLKQAEAALQEKSAALEAMMREAGSQKQRAEARFQELYDTSPVMYASVDAKSARVHACNAATANRLGYTKGEIIGRPVFELYHPDCMDQVRQAFGQFVATGIVDEAELDLMHSDGSKIPVKLSVRAVLDDHGEIEHSISTWREISDVRRLEALSSQLARSNEELEHFAYVVSHDLQEPLRMVTSFTRLLEDRIADADAESRKYMDFVLEGAQRMQSMIEDILAYSRVDRAERDQKVDVGATVEEICQDLTVSISEASAEIPVSELPTVTYNATQMRQVLQNLIVNGLRFRGDTAPVLQLGAERVDEGFKFWVGDNGIGIEPQHVERIFKMFQRLHGRETYAGNGIGLAMCKKIVEQHGGRIWVESAKGAGSTFYFTVPDLA